MIFRCKVCLEKDKRIADLQAQIADLRQFTIPKDTSVIPLIQVESDAILSGSDEIREIPKEQLKEFEDAMYERDRLLSGQY